MQGFREMRAADQRVAVAVFRVLLDADQQPVLVFEEAWRSSLMPAVVVLCFSAPGGQPPRRSPHHS